jgi:RecA-family ATPase
MIENATKRLNETLEQRTGVKPPLPPGAQAPEENANGAKMEPLSFRTLREILNMQFDDADFVLGNGYLTKGESSAVCGAGGIGKSRLITQLIRDILTGRPFLGRWITKGKDIRVMVLQSENSNRRMKADLWAQCSMLTEGEIDHIDQHCLFHTLENSDDSFLTLANIENQQRIEDAIAKYKPDLIVWDVLRDFAVDDPNSDKFMQQTLSLIGRLTRKHNPACIALILHHGRTGKAGAASTTGFDRGSFGRNSKVLFSWVRAQINVAPYDENDNDTLIIASGKCNNAEEFRPFAVRLNKKTLSYEVDESITQEDIEAWHEEMGGKPTSAKAKKKKTPKEIKAAIMMHVPEFGSRPKKDVAAVAVVAGIPRDTVRDFLRVLVLEQELFEWKIKRDRVYEVHLARYEQLSA